MSKTWIFDGLHLSAENYFGYESSCHLVCPNMLILLSTSSCDSIPWEYVVVLLSVTYESWKVMNLCEYQLLNIAWWKSFVYWSEGLLVAFCTLPNHMTLATCELPKHSHCSPHWRLSLLVYRALYAWCFTTVACSILNISNWRDGDGTGLGTGSWILVRQVPCSLSP